MRKAHIWVAGVFLQVKDLLDLLLDELIADIPLSDDAVRAWSEDPAQEKTSLQTLVDCIERIERGGAIMGIDGFVSSLQYVSMYAQAMVGNADATSMAWLNGWYRPAKIYLTQPSSLQAISAMTDYLRDCPLAMDADSLSSLADLLAIAPTLPHEDETPSLVAATDEDVSLAVDDIDTDLLQALLSDAPEQLERLLEIVESFSTKTVAPEQLQEAQRIAHTLKGSGNIIGLPGIGRMAHRLEDLMDFALESARQHLDLPPAMVTDMVAAVQCLQQMVGFLQGEDAAPEHAKDILQNLLVWVGIVQDGTANTATLEEATLSRSNKPARSSQATMLVTTPKVVAAVVTKPESKEATHLRVGVARMARLVRRAEQSMVGAQRLGQMLENSAQKLSQIDQQHASLSQRLNALELAVGRQLVDLRDQGGDLDPLEMDRYDALYTLTRFITEAVDDEFELSRQARTETERAISLLRGENHLRKDQYSELLDARLVQVKTIVPRLKRNITQTAAATGKYRR